MRYKSAVASFVLSVLVVAHPAGSLSAPVATFSLKTEALAPESGVIKRAVIVLHASEGHSGYMTHIASTLR